MKGRGEWIKKMKKKVLKWINEQKIENEKEKWRKKKNEKKKKNDQKMQTWKKMEKRLNWKNL